MAWSWRVGTDDVRHVLLLAQRQGIHRVRILTWCESEKEARGPIETRDRVWQPVMSSVDSQDSMIRKWEDDGKSGRTEELD